MLLAAWSEGSRERLSQVVEEHGLKGMKPVESLKKLNEAPKNLVVTAVLGIEAGFETDDLVVVGEQDILGDRLVRRRGARSERRTSSPRCRA